MTKFFKSFLSVALVAVVSASMLAGCGSDGSKSTADEAAAVAGIKQSPVVSCFGTQGTYTDEAAKLFFKDAKFFHYQTSLDKIIEDVRIKKSDYAVIPVETTSAGAMQTYVDALIKNEKIAVVGEVELTDNLALLGLKGAKQKDIKTVVSYQQALTSTEKWLKENLSKAKQTKMNNASAAAKYVVNRKDKSNGVIAPAGIAKLNGLEVLTDNIQDSSNNKTRFYVLALNKLEAKDKKRAVFTVKCDADKIDDVIVEINKAGFDIVALHDRPDASKLGKYKYLIEVKADSVTQDKIDKVTGHDGVRYAGCFNVIEK